MHYVMSDIHGNYDAFMRMIKLINFKKRDHLYILGDIIDRGPDGLEVLKYIMEHDNIVLFRGNHERDMCAAVCQNATELTPGVLGKFRLWFLNGGEVTYHKLLEEYADLAENMVHFLNCIPDYGFIRVKKKDYLLVHAGFIEKDDLTLEENLELNKACDFLYDARRGFLDKKLDFPFKVIAGHTPVDCLGEYIEDLSDGDRERCKEHKMVILEDKILIDCGCGFGHRLGCLRLEDLKEFYTE